MHQATVQTLVDWGAMKAKYVFLKLSGLAPIVSTFAWITFALGFIKSTITRARCLLFGRCDTEVVELSIIERRLIIPFLRLCAIPLHIGFIMDGNRRYAKSHNEQTVVGHKMGYDRLRRVLLWCFELGVKEVSVYAFSMDNFSRTPEEVEYLMDLAETKLASLCEDNGFVMKQRIRVRICGDCNLLRPSLQEVIRMVETKTAHHENGIFNVLLAYSSKRELNQAIERTVQERSDITWDRIESKLYNPTPLDLIVRTSGETRLSDFLIWQIQPERTVIVFERHMWPEFSIADFARSLIKNHYRAESLSEPLMGVRGG
jgi:ditrans,polycis-polyprenyl diphosphate synthase